LVQLPALNANLVLSILIWDPSPPTPAKNAHQELIHPLLVPPPAWTAHLALSTQSLDKPCVENALLELSTPLLAPRAPVFAKPAQLAHSPWRAKAYALFAHLAHSMPIFAELDLKAAFCVLKANSIPTLEQAASIRAWHVLLVVLLVLAKAIASCALKVLSIP